MRTLLTLGLLTTVHGAMVAVENSQELPGLNGVFAQAIRSSDLAELGRLAAEYAAANKTILDVVGRDVMEAFLNEQDEMKAEVSRLPDIREKDELLGRLNILEEWADQVDNGVNFLLYGGTEYLFDRLITGGDDAEVKKAMGRVLVASLQNNEKALELFLQRQPNALKRLTDALSLFEEPRWLLSVGSALLRRTPEIRVGQQVAENDQLFIAALKKLSGNMADKAKDILDFFSHTKK